MKHIQLLLLLLLFGGSTFAGSPWQLRGCIRHFPFARISLGAFYGGSISVVDSTAVVNGCFDFKIPDSTAPGMYVLLFNKERTAYLELILNRASVVLDADYTDLAGSIRFKGPDENELLYQYIRGNEAEKEAALSAMIRQHPAAVATCLIRAQHAAQYGAGLSGPDKDRYYDAHYWDQVDFSNAALVHSNILPSMILDHIGHYQQPGISYQQQVERSAAAIDAIIARASANREVYDFTIRFLKSRYEYGDYDLLGAYVREYYGADDHCEGEATTKDIGTRIARLRFTAVGRQAPEITMPAYNGGTAKLSELKNEYVLLVFWSSYCDHCIKTLPKILQVYNHRRGDKLEVLAVSFDTDRERWQAFLQTGNYSWINYSDLQGWDSEIAKSYNIQGTPTYMLLDKNKQIIAKPAVLEEVVAKLQELGII